MYQVCHYSPAERQMEKERSRAADAYALRSGSRSRDDLRRNNGFFSSLEIVDSSIIGQEAFA